MEDLTFWRCILSQLNYTLKMLCRQRLLLASQRGTSSFAVLIRAALSLPQPNTTLCLPPGCFHLRKYCFPQGLRISEQGGKQGARKPSWNNPQCQVWGLACIHRQPPAWLRRGCVFSLSFPSSWNEMWNLLINANWEILVFSKDTGQRPEFLLPANTEGVPFLEGPHLPASQGIRKRQHQPRALWAGDLSVCSPVTFPQCHPCLLSHHLFRVVSLLPLPCSWRTANLFHCTASKLVLVLCFEIPTAQRSFRSDHMQLSVKVTKTVMFAYL